MNIMSRCPDCLAVYKLSENTVGRKAKCRCGHVFVVNPSQPVPEIPASTLPESDQVNAKTVKVQTMENQNIKKDVSSGLLHKPSTLCDSFFAIASGIGVVFGIIGLIIGSRGTQITGNIITMAFFPGIAAFSSFCVFAPNKILSNPRISATIGTKNPLAARIVCVIAAIVLWVLSISPFI
jgi:hypothetical protein